MAIEIIDKLKQKNNGNFKLMDAEDVNYDNKKSVNEALNELYTKIDEVKTVDSKNVVYGNETVNEALDKLYTKTNEEISIEDIKYNEEKNLKEILDELVEDDSSGSGVYYINNVDEIPLITDAQKGSLIYVPTTEEMGEMLFIVHSVIENGDKTTTIDNYTELSLGGGENAVVNLTSDFNQSSFSTTEEVIIPYNFYAENVGKGTLYVQIKNSSGNLINKTYPINIIGDNTVNLGLFNKDSYTLEMYALDSRGNQSNLLTFVIAIGSLEVTSTFNEGIDYEITDNINIPFNVYSVNNREIEAHIVCDGKEYTQSATKGYNSFQLLSSMKTVGVHTVELYLTNGVETSNRLSFNVIIVGAGTILLSTKQTEISVEYGYNINLKYRISMIMSANVSVSYYIDTDLKGTYTVPTGENVWRITDRIESGSHVIKIVANQGTLKDELIIPVIIKESTYVPVESVETGLIAYFNANDKTNYDENKSTWTSRVPDENGDYATATLSNYNFSTDGWQDGWLHSTIGTYATINMQPLKDNILAGFTFDVVYRSIHSGDDNNIVVDCTSDNTEIGFRITSDNARIKGDSNDIKIVYLDNEETRITFVVDRGSTYIDSDGSIKENPTVQIYLNGVLSSASLLTDSGSGSNRIYESFVTTSNVYLNGLKGDSQTGETYIKSIRIYNRPLGYEEILQNVIADIEDMALQREEYEKNYTLLEQLIPTMYMYDTSIGTHANMTKDNKQFMRIRYDSPDEEKFGESFDFPVCETAWQGTSSLDYPIKNYKFKCYDYTYNENNNPISTTDSSTFVKKKINPYTDGTGYEESTFCLKAD